MSTGHASDFIPALKYGNKIFPQDLAGGIGQPVVGNVWFVDPVNGLDTNGGRSQEDAFNTVSKANSVAVDNGYDVIILSPEGVGSGSSSEESAVLTWSNNLTTLLGAAAPSNISQRSRITFTTAGIDTGSGCFALSGSGNRFLNVQVATFVDNNGLFGVAGDRNYFGNVHFAGIGDATAGDDTSAWSLSLADADENLFEGCTIGLDTVARSTSNTELAVLLESQRNSFKGCDFISFADNAGHFFVTVSAQGIDRWIKFEGCGFINAINSTATTMTDAMSIDAAPGGSIILKDCYKIGATGWADNLTSVQALAVSSNSTYNQGIGFAVNPAA